MTRIISTMLSRNYLYDVTKNMSNVQTLQTQLSTGKEISKPSDDPYKASRIIKMYADIGANEQYNDNITDATNFLDVTDTSLTQMSNLLSRVRELLVSAGNAAYGSEQLKSIQDEMSAKVNQLAQIMNTNFDGKYVFGGTKVDSKPVTVVDGKIQYADESGNSIAVYKDAETNKYTKSPEKVVVSAGKINETENASVKNDIQREYDPLKDKLDAYRDDPTANLPLTEEENARLNELKSMLDGATVYKDNDGNYTASKDSAVKNISVEFKDIKDLTNDTLSVDQCAEGEKDKILDSIKYYNQISSDMKLEISQGVIVNYNQTANDILEFKDKETGNTINVSDLFSDIIENLNSVDGKSKLTGENLGDLDKVISNVLSKSSEVGALQNRMEAAKTQNESDNYNLTSILANVEDIDFTEKMIDFSTLMTVYKASLQISANILPKTIMDYL